MANMITELNIVQPVIHAGRKIDTFAYPITNYRLHCATQWLSRLSIAALEGDSNNQSTTMTPTDVVEHRLQYRTYKTEMAFAMNHNDGPMTTLEDRYAVLLPSGKEIQRTVNVKCKRVVMEVIRLARIVLSTDAAKSQANISNEDRAKIARQELILEDAMDLYWGSGADNDSTGIKIPDYDHVGTLAPDLDLDFNELAEASADAPPSGLDDVPDTSS